MRVAVALGELRERSYYAHDRDLVFCRPETGKPLDRSKLIRRFKQALDVSVCFNVGRSASVTGFDEHQPFRRPRSKIECIVLPAKNGAMLIAQIGRDGQAVRLAPALQLEPLGELSWARSARARFVTPSSGV